MKTEVISPRACIDRQCHTCIEFFRDHFSVKFIPLSIGGFEVQVMDIAEFDRTYKPIKDYPIDKAAKLYAEYATQLGGTKEAMQTLATIVPLTSKEIEMATTKKTASAENKTAKAATAKANTKTATAKKAKPAAKAAPEPKAKKVAGADGDKPQSAADMFRTLIVEGKLSDDEIFTKVQKAHNLDDNKRRYVSFYRFDAKRKGLIK
jgi:hypothetical protein